MRPAALVISPFASVPRDAGHRRRVHQMTSLLADGGYGVTFLLLAFEDGWAWSHDGELHAELRAAWDDVIIVHAADHVGRPPLSGATHGLDEWWDLSLQATLANLATRRFFDVIVVHNVWLSKSFDFVHPASTKVLETHDLFWKRIDAFARIGAPAAFFVTDRESELFGLQRADIVVTIQSAEAHELLTLTTRRVVNVPFYDAALQDAAEPETAGFAHRDKVSFGFLASANPFNIHGANQLLAALERAIGESFAPVEIVVGGSVGPHLRSLLPVRRLGAVPTERGFYEAVDYAIAPVFEGTGFKVKTADALAIGRPLLAAAHAADGTSLDPSLVFATPADMAACMARIALRRPDPRQAAAHVRRARDDLRRRAAEGEAYLLGVLATAAVPAVIDLDGIAADTAQGMLRLQSWLGVLRVLVQARPVVLVLPHEMRIRVGRLLPPGVRAIALGERQACLARWPRSVVVAGGEGAMLPLHPNLLWEAAALRLREMWAETPAGRAALADPARMLVLCAGRAARRFAADPVIAMVDPSDDEAVASLLLRLLSGPVAAPGSEARSTEIVCAAAPVAIRQAFLDVCVLRNLVCHGHADDAARVAVPLPPASLSDLARRAAAAAQARIDPHSKKEPLCLAA